MYNHLDGNERSVWSLFLASGYLKVLFYESYLDIPEGTQPQYELALTNFEIQLMFEDMVLRWFSPAKSETNEFVRSL